MRHGPELPGISRTKYIHVVWDTPVLHEHNLNPITHYELRAARPSALEAYDETLLGYAASAGGGLVAEGGAELGSVFTSIQGAELEPGEEVSFTVRACGLLGCGDFSSATLLGTLTSVPGDTPMPTLQDINSTSIVVALTSPAEFDGGSPLLHYQMHFATSPPSIEWTVELPPTLPQHVVVSPRDLDLAYVVRARAASAIGEGAWSAELEVASGANELPASPEGLVVVDGSVGARRFEVEWRMPLTNRTALFDLLFYRLEMVHAALAPGESACSGSCVWWTDYVIVPTASNCTAGCAAVLDAAIAPATVYQLRIMAVNSLGSSLGSNVEQTQTLPAPPEMSGQPIVTTVQQAAISVSWARASQHGALMVAHRVWACDVQSGGCSALLAGSDATGATIALPSGRNYTVAVEAINTVGTSGNVSAAGTHTTLAPPMRGHAVALAPPLPGLSPRTTLRVVWAPSFANGRPITGYELSIDGAVVTVGASAETPQYTLVNLVPATNHSFSVAAVNSLGTGPASETRAFSTADDVPGTPDEPEELETNATTVLIEVKGPPYTGGYPIDTYELRCGHLNGTIVEVPPPTPDGGAARYMVRPRVLDVEYTFASRTVTVFGRSAWSDELVIASVTSLYPAIPGGLAIADVDARRFTLDWRAPAASDGVVRYSLTIESDSAEDVVLQLCAPVMRTPPRPCLLICQRHPKHNISGMGWSSAAKPTAATSPSTASCCPPSHRT